MANTTVLITGANRGLGRALTTRYLARPATTVIAAVRDPSHPTAQSLASLPLGADGSALITVKIEATSDTDAAAAVALLQRDHGITKLDVVVANAGFGTVYGDLSQAKIDDVRELYDINAIGPLRLFQAVRPLLEAEGTERPRFVLIGTPIASIGAMEKSPFPMLAYGMSKAAAHYMTRKVHCESERLTAFVVDPGFAQTDMGNTGARYFGYEQAFVPVDVSGDFLFGTIEKATREEAGGKFLTISEGEDFIDW
ncbi:putative aflatoxin biosynthesis ketoreductase nor-1 [Bombardia bombarda]|uniref:Aflatoxin biosynthesis ketoreductase nor-1 n=1 Tax=Bombardia bombarda TaxID=252184 RepID=A0AA39WU25_9PEZI|nr:putative aflatoxin biosynthesis ketoreductase nor-1 [Bombardia bombarda]